jgi:hypothetical protein
MKFMTNAMMGVAIAAMGCCSASYAGYIIEIDTDGLDNGVVTWNPNFGFAADTSAATQSVAVPGFGTSGGDSIFGGNGSISADTYVYFYTPGFDADNLAIPQGQSLGGHHRGTGVTTGTPGIYRVYALWQDTNNVSGGDVTYSIVSDFDVYEVTVDQNNDGGGEWFLLGDIDYQGGAITVFQTATSNTFISMRATALLFEQVSHANSCEGDANGDGTVDVNDISYVVFRLGHQCP